VENGPVELAWSEVSAAEVLDDGRNKRLRIGSPDGEQHLSMAALDAFAVLDALADWKPSAVEPDAFERLSYVQEFRGEQDALIQLDLPVRTRLARWLVLLGWTGFLFFAGIMVLSVSEEGPFYILAFGPFVLLCAYLLHFAYSVVEIDAEAIRLLRPLLPTQELRWSELDAAGIDPQGYNLVLWGSGKRLVLPGPDIWRSRDSAAVSTALDSFLTEGDIETRIDRWAGFKLSKGTRAPRRR
jgi:hypothetical protein